MCNVVGCTWNVGYTYVKKLSGYVILDKGKSDVKYYTNLCLEHNHPVNECKIGGYVEIKNEADITQSKANTICTLSLIHSKIPSITNALQTEYSSER